MALAQPAHLAFLRCGHIGTALLQALLPSISHPQSPISKITVSPNRPECQAYLHDEFCNNSITSPVNFLLRQNTKVAQQADAVLFAFPPSQLPAVLKAPYMQKALLHKPIISAGIHGSAALVANSPEGHPTPKRATHLATQIFATVGKVFRIPDPSFDAATGVSAFLNALVTVAVREIVRADIAEGVPRSMRWR